MGIAGAYAGLHAGLARAMMGSGGMGGGGVAIVDPQPGAAFYDVPNAEKNRSGVYVLNVKQTKLRLNGTSVNLLTYNGMYPGPTIRASRGEMLKVQLVNGRVNPVLSIRPGQVQRWQIVNACNARFLKLSLDRHFLYLVGTDGGLLYQPYELSSILRAPGERIDVLVKADQAGGNFKFLSLPYDRGMSSLQQVTLLTLAYGGISTTDVLPGTVNANASRLVMDTSALTRRSLTLSMMMGRGYINGISFTDTEHTYNFMSHLDSWEVWEIVHNSGMDHPFHQHVNSCRSWTGTAWPCFTAT